MNEALRIGLREMERPSRDRESYADAHLAALAMEYGLVLHTTDRDFSRFSGLRWRNPLDS